MIVEELHYGMRDMGAARRYAIDIHELKGHRGCVGECKDSKCVRNWNWYELVLECGVVDGKRCAS